jgi:hypothetical protein
MGNNCLPQFIDSLNKLSRLKIETDKATDLALGLLVFVKDYRGRKLNPGLEFQIRPIDSTS